MNNKGQSLVLFVLILPICLLILVMIIDISKMVLLKNEINNINYLAIDYALDNYDHFISDNINTSKEIEKLIYKNKSNVNGIILKNENNKLYITIKCYSDMLIFRDTFIVTSEYVGYLINDEKRIERVK